MPFVKGQSGNPAGRKPGTKLKGTAFKEALARVIESGVGLDEIARALIAKGLAGDVSALKEIADRLDGKVATVIAGDPEAPMVTKVVREIVRTEDQDREGI